MRKEIEIPITEKLEVIQSESLNGLDNKSSFNELKRVAPTIAFKLFNIIKKENIEITLPYIILTYRGCKAWLTKEQYEKGN